MTTAVPLLKFTPSAQDPAVLEAITVQREPLIADLVDAALDVDAGRRHHLLVGPRGIGKSHVLAITTQRLLDSDRRSGIVIAALDEDPWPIRSYAKLLAAIAAAAAGDLGDSELARRAAELRAHVGRESEHDGEQLIREVAGERRLVVVMENSDEIFRRIRPDGQARLRALAENWPGLLILGSTPQLFAGVSRHTSPFYGFFRITHLDELTPDNAHELLRRVAALRGDEPLQRFLDTDVARRRLLAINSLAGGHPRIWLLFAGCLSIPAIEQLVPLFLEALDDLTPYYQARLRELGDQQQELVVILCEARGAIGNRALAERSGLAQNQVAATLGQLAARGYVRRASLPDALNGGDARASFWELREPLMRLCLEVKQSRGEPLRLVVEFLRSWYGDRILDELARLPESARLATAYATAAFEGLGGALDVKELLAGSAAAIVARAERGLQLRPDDVALRVTLAVGLAGEKRVTEARDTFAGLLKRELSAPARLMLDVVFAEALAEVGESPDFEVLCERAAAFVVAEPDNAAAQSIFAQVLLRVGRREDAVEACERAAQFEPRSARYASRLGNMLFAVGRYADALAAYTQASALGPDMAWYQSQCGLALRRLGRHEEALDAHGRAIALEPNEPRHHLDYALELLGIGRVAEATEATKRAVSLDADDADAAFVLATMLMMEGHTEEAGAAVAHAVSLDAASPAIRIIAAEIALSHGNRDETVSQFRHALELRHKDPGRRVAEPLFTCRILWDRRGALIDDVVEVWAGSGALGELVSGLVDTIPLFVDDAVSQADAEAWLQAWRTAVDARTELDIALDMIAAAVEWKRTGDRAHLLALPPEQREIVVGLLTPAIATQ
jgi:tetratricopeptide (TPR) repeat protein